MLTNNVVSFEQPGHGVQESTFWQWWLHKLFLFFFWFSTFYEDLQTFKALHSAEFLFIYEFVLYSAVLTDSTQESESSISSGKYRIYPAIRRGFWPSRMTSNN